MRPGEAMPYRTRLVELARRPGRAAVDNLVTIHAAPSRSRQPCDFRRLFASHYTRIRATCLDFAEPGIAVFAFSLRDGTWQGSMCLAARPGEVRAGVVGRHSAADLSLDGDRRGLALRHLLYVIEPLPLRAAFRGEVRFRVMDLETGHPPRDEEGRAVASLTAEGPVFLSCSGVALLAFVTGDTTDWPESAADAWDIQPERIFIDERLASGSAPRRHPFAARPALDPLRTTIVRQAGPRHVGDLRSDEAPCGHLDLTTTRGRHQLCVGADVLGRGVLFGRYERCHSHAAAVILTERVSRVHLLVMDLAGDLVAIDLGSSNGTFVVDPEGGFLTPLRIGRLVAGQVLALGSRRILLSWHPAD